MTHSFKAITLVALLALPSAAFPVQRLRQKANKSQSQTSTEKPGENNSQDSAATTHQRALTLLKQLLAQADSISSDIYKPIKVVLFRAQVADILWNEDQSRARELFAEAFKAADAFNPNNPKGRLLSAQADLTLNARLEILRLVLPHDVHLAERLTDSLFDSSTKMDATNPFPYDFRQQMSLRLEIAEHVATADPQRAEKLIKLSTANGWFSYQQVEALKALKRSSPALADELFLYLLSIVKDRPSHLTTKLGLLAPYVFQENQHKPNQQPVKVDAAQATENHSALLQAFLAFAYETLMQQPVETQINEPNEFGKSAFDSVSMDEIVEQCERYLPEKAPLLRARIEEIKSKIEQARKKDVFTTEDEAWRELFRIDIQEMLGKAEAEKDNEKKDILYGAIAFVLGVRDSDFDRAFTVVSKMSNDRIRAEALSQIRGQAIEKATKDGEAEKAYQYSRDIREPRSQAPILIGIAEIYAKRGDAQQALRILRETEKVLSSIGIEGSERATLKVRLANAAAGLEPEWGFEAMRAAVTAINESLASRDLTHPSIGLGDGKIDFDNRFSYEPGFERLARADFDRALQLAKSLQSKEASMLAQLAVCKGGLSK